MIECNINRSLDCACGSARDDIRDSFARDDKAGSEQKAAVAHDEGDEEIEEFRYGEALFAFR